MRMGVMVGPEGGDAARKLGRMIRDAEWAENAGFDSIWIPQVPSDFDALIAVAAVGAKTSRVEIGTAVVPLHAQHPIALARQVLSAHAVSGGRVVLGIGPSHHWIVQDMLGIPYSKPAAYTRDVLDVLDKALHGPGPVDVENNSFTVHNPLDLEPVAPEPRLELDRKGLRRPEAIARRQAVPQRHHRHRLHRPFQSCRHHPDSLSSISSYPSVATCCPDR